MKGCEVSVKSTKDEVRFPQRPHIKGSAAGSDYNEEVVEPSGSKTNRWKDLTPVRPAKHFLVHHVGFPSATR